VEGSLCGSQAEGKAAGGLISLNWKHWSGHGGKMKTLSHSKMQAFKVCRRRYYWEYEYGIRPEVTPTALRMGTALHDALDRLKKGGTLQQALVAIDAHYAVAAGQSEYERSTVVTLVCHYAEHWHEEPVQVIASELRFELPILNPETGRGCKHHILTGFIDAIVQLPGGRTVVMEHKTTSSDIEPEADYWRILTLDSQITLYVYAAQRLGYEVDTVLYDVIRKPSIKPLDVPVLDDEGLKIVFDRANHRVLNVNGKPRQTASTADGYRIVTRPMAAGEWASRLSDDILSRPKYYFGRQEIPRLHDDLDEAAWELWDISQSVQIATARKHWYKTCSRDTCKYCPYIGLCETHFDPTPGIVPGGFVRVERKTQPQEEVLI
jgi:CRISPR/Cas system-associated exonuclease Cas4 (RecB family)